MTQDNTSTTQEARNHDAEIQAQLDRIVAKLEAYHPAPDVEKLRRAAAFAAACHEGQFRRSGEPYILHPLAVAEIVADLRLDTDSLCAALLHDVIEDTDTTCGDVREQFGDEITDLVDGLTKIGKLRFNTREERQAENFRKMLIAMSRDLRVVLVKLCDRVHNMRTLEHMSTAKQQEIAQETLDIYTPLANRLGISWLKVELEDLAFRYLHPDGYEDLVKQIAMGEEERQRYIDEVIGILERVLKKNGLEDFETQGRPKHLFSLYRKMTRSNIDFDQIYDMLAFRIITDSVAQCYEALGVVHGLWKPIPGRFKDYIALPKNNLYRSLHTSVLGPYRKRIEIQIRTQDMHRINEHGIAAHWRYKEGKIQPDDGSRTFDWLRQLMDWQQDLSDPREFLETVKIDLFADEVYIFTPTGELRSFPKGATPVDFAYTVHTEVGNHCTGAKVNGQIVPLRYQMRNGDMVEILTSKNQQPKQDWLQFVVTGRARNKIRHHVRKEQRERSREIGRNLVEKFMRRASLNLAKLEKNGGLLEAAKQVKCTSIEELFIQIGYGRVQPETLIARLKPPPETAPPDTPKAIVEAQENRVTRFINNVQRRSKSGIKVGGVDDIMVRTARCCSPVPGEPITGFITRGRGVTVHSRSCPRIRHLEQEREIDCEWDNQATTKEDKRAVNVRVICADRPGLLANISQSFSLLGVNISQAHCRTTEDRRAINTFEVLVRDAKQLKLMIRSIAKLPGVYSVERIRL